MAQTTAKVGQHLSLLVNNDITLMERKLIQRIETLKEMDQQPMARLQRSVSEL